MPTSQLDISNPSLRFLPGDSKSCQVDWQLKPIITDMLSIYKIKMSPSKLSTGLCYFCHIQQQWVRLLHCLPVSLSNAFTQLVYLLPVTFCSSFSNTSKYLTSGSFGTTSYTCLHFGSPTLLNIVPPSPTPRPIHPCSSLKSSENRGQKA